MNINNINSNTVSNSAVTIAPLEKTHYDAWLNLYKGYALYYNVQLTKKGIATVWSWLHNSSHSLTGLVALQGGTPIALAHFREMPNPLMGCNIGWLDDLFVALPYRGQSLAEKLILAVAAEAKKRHWPVLRWSTKENNYRARTVYDGLASKFDRITYQMEVGE